MILQALTAYYEQLREQKKVEAPGWDSKFKVSYELRLGPDGQLLALNDLRQEVPKDKKTVIAPRELPVPHRVKRASGVAANFLCDNTSYLLGADEKGKPERSRQCFEACAALHHKVLDGVDSPAAKAILAFFDSWNPAAASTHPLLAEQWADLNNNANLVFGYESPDGAHWLATTDDAIRTAWQSAFDTSDADAETARCLITGKEVSGLQLLWHWWDCIFCVCRIRMDFSRRICCFFAVHSVFPYRFYLSIIFHRRLMGYVFP